MSRRKLAGWVYLVRNPFGSVKIGSTSDMETRMATYPHCELLHAISSSNARRLELTLHAHYDDKRRNREWFALSEADVAFLRTFSTEADVVASSTIATGRACFSWPVTFYVSPALHRRIERAARRLGLHFNEYVRHALAEASACDGPA